ncbi:MAG: bifunctional transaldolase/phosoglucose isomerase [Alphaproteobacteria bacterium]|nr:bifunctional transaldolase/phosoglucose isomerase [Alphaproteobacteria bacterium]
MLTSGKLERLIAEDGLRGMTSNPSIFEKAIGEGGDYDEDLRAFAGRGGANADAIYEHLAIADIQRAADLLRPVYDATQRRDGYVSLEVSPYLAMKTKETVAEAQRLWKSVGRENLMVKVPGTKAGVPAIRQLIGEGININVTLLFARSAYEQVAEAFLAGLEDRVAKGGDVSKLASVASFFVSRIDSAIDQDIEKRLKAKPSATDRAALEGLLGKVAIANAKLAYQHYKTLEASPRWQKLAQQGAQLQRLLWASTSTKNKAYRDVMYVEELIGDNTVNTMPPATMDAFRDHGQARASLEEGIDAAEGVMASLERVGIDLAKVTETLVKDGVRLFADAADKLLGVVERKREAILGGKLDRPSYSLKDPLKRDVDAALEDWRQNGKLRRLWARDATLWTGADEAKWLGWLDIVERQLADLAPLQKLAAEAKQGGLSHCLLLGMGGSSLGPEVLAETFGRQKGFPELLVLDSTDPAQIRAFEKRIDIAKTLFIVSSKSGTTLEPNIYKQYFFEKAKAALGAEKAGERFVAITDPGSKLESVAKQDSFRHVYHGDPAIGGRYSVLSDFGMAPAAAMGLDLADFLGKTADMVRSCGPDVPASQNPGAVLGAVMGVLAKHGRDKVTIVASPGISDFGAWLEQLLAESTGKQGKGLVPVDNETLGAPEVYGTDRLFAYLRLENEADPAQDRAIEALERAGQPVVRLALADRSLLGQEFFRWEIATAVAGAIIGIDPFDQPDVEASKVKTRELTAAYEKTGALPSEKPIFEGEGVKLFTDDRNARELARLGAADSLDSYLATHLARLAKGDYAAILAYVERSEAHIEVLQRLRMAIRDHRRVATCLGFGPRFLHSTGQAYKGGPNSGVFLQITCDDRDDLAVPAQKYSFGIVKAAQARGDFDVLAERGRRALRVHLGADVTAGLVKLCEAVERVLS